MGRCPHCGNDLAILGPTRILGRRFEIRGSLGEGPLGLVWRAFDREIEVDVAVKVLREGLVSTPDARSAFVAATAEARGLSHPNLVRVFHAGVDGEDVFFAMQLVEGLSLRKLLELRKEKKEPLSLGEVEPIVAQIATALEALHGVSPHGNLKPENILLLPDLLKIADFFLAAALPREPFVKAQAAAGTSAYLAPEVRGGGDLVPASDVFSLGVLAAEMLTGVVATDPSYRATAHRPDLPGEVDAIIGRCLDPDPAQRPDPASVAREILALAGEGATSISAARARGAVTRAGRPRTGTTPRPGPAPGPDRASSTPRPAPFEPELPPYATDASSRPRPAPPPLPAGASLPDAGAPAPPREGPTVAGPPPGGEEAEATTILPPGRPPAIVQAVRPRRPVPLPVWIALILAVIGGGTYGAIRYIDQLHLDEEAALLREQEEVKRRLAEERARQQALRDELSARERKAQETAALARSKAEEAARAAKADPRKKEEAERLAAEAERKERERLRLARRRKEAERRAREARADEAKEVAAAPAPEVKPAEPAPPEKSEKLKETLVASAAAPAVATEPKKRCPPGMARVKAGSFRMGSASDDPMRNFGEPLLAKVSTEEYCIDRYEYPNARGATPLTGVSWERAQALCQAKGKRLCTEAEWERACKGWQGYRFPYGDEFDESRCNSETAKGEHRPIAPAGAFPACRSSYGVYDLSGNVAEWTATPLSPASRARIIKGGASNKPDWFVRCANRWNKPATARDPNVGFRCCANPE